ncbi:hypothetical protein K2173_023277 [Erythroxylum novogranatense]|uniref:THH1/TOM1/TOM3 domain-containing protein n=1 Tax=Erythroxylum novogranatense TaxID=1862640 RepID=A0AAV8T8F2_9ROSI|nr:hypothetical protein K2173_023277 [Erythroxylum novogranatense]
MLNLGSSFYLFEFLIVTVALACVDAALAFIAFFQLTRIQFRTWQLGWTRQKVLHLMIGSSNLGYFLYFILTPIATCNGWLWWSNACGFFFMAFPEILFLAAFLLLLSFWVDLCHQANDEEDEDEDEENCSQQPLLESSKGKPNLSHVDYRWRCCSFCGIHIGSRQKFVIVVVVMAFILMALFAVLIWIGAGKNPIDSSIVAQVYVKLFAAAILLLGLALGSYGLLLFLKLRGVTYENASSEMWKVINLIAGLAVISVICFTSSSLLALLTEVPLFYCWNLKKLQETKTTFLLVVYYFLGSSVPSAFVLWIMRELPAQMALCRSVQSHETTFISHVGEGTQQHSGHWVTSTSSKNQVLKASPI